MKRLLSLALAAAAAAAGTAAADAPLVSRLTKYVDELPIPPVIDVATTPGKKAVLDLHMTAQTTKLHRELPETQVWGYQGSSPGPTISVERGQELEVRWTNDLPKTHIYARPEGADETGPDVRAVTHLHGAAVAEPDPTDRHLDSDGWPDNWLVAGETQRAIYPNDQAARLLWYHDHAMGVTGRNVAAGMIGAYEIHDPFERSLNLPSGPYEIPLIFQSKLLKDDGTWGYTADIGKEFYGNAVAVNGKLFPVLTVEPRKYRFRVLNASNARTYGLRFFDAADAAVPGPAFHQIGSDAGFLAAPVLLNDPANARAPRLVLASAERADIVVDFAAFAGRTLVLSNNGRDVSDDERPIPELMQVRVLPAVSAPDTSTLPAKLQGIVRLKPEDAAQTRTISFDQMDMGGKTMLALNGKMWMDPIEERPVLGTTEVWQLANTLMNAHPFHIHLVEFQVLDRRLFDVQAYLETGKITYMADSVPPAPGEMGWKDVVQVYPQMVTRIIMRFAPFPGYYVYHCHILEHEDMDMMRPFQVVDSAASR